MGRPIKKKFFGSLTTPYQNQATGGRTGVGAEGIASIAVANTLTNAGYSTSTAVTRVAVLPKQLVVFLHLVLQQYYMFRV